MVRFPVGVSPGVTAVSKYNLYWVNACDVPHLLIILASDQERQVQLWVTSCETECHWQQFLRVSSIFP
jgi:hypothetical protein